MSGPQYRAGQRVRFRRSGKLATFIGYAGGLAHLDIDGFGKQQWNVIHIEPLTADPLEGLTPDMSIKGPHDLIATIAAQHSEIERLNHRVAELLTANNALVEARRSVTRDFNELTEDLSAIAAATVNDVKAEREACAKIADDLGSHTAARAIRART